MISTFSTREPTCLGSIDEHETSRHASWLWYRWPLSSGHRYVLIRRISGANYCPGATDWRSWPKNNEPTFWKWDWLILQTKVLSRSYFFVEPFLPCVSPWCRSSCRCLCPWFELDLFLSSVSLWCRLSDLCFCPNFELEPVLSRICFSTCFLCLLWARFGSSAQVYLLARSRLCWRR